MSLLELEAPYRTVRVVDYLHQNTAVIKNRRLQHIVGNLYKDREKIGSCDYSSCIIYAFYPEIKMGVVLEHISRLNEWTPERLLQKCVELKYDSFAMYQENIKNRIEKGFHIPNASILLLDMFAPELAVRAKEAKKVYEAKRDEEIRQHKKEMAHKHAASIASSNDDAAAQLLKIVGNIRAGAFISASETHFYRKNEALSEYNCLNLLADIYGVSIPANVRGWVNRQCVGFEVRDGKITSVRNKKTYSQTFSDYMQQVVDAVLADSENTAIARWRNGLYMVPEETAA